MAKLRGVIAFSLVLLCLITSSAVYLQPVKAQSNTIVVPNDYSTIQTAINNAVNGDTIFVKTGVYEEQELILNKTIALVGEDPRNTIINLYPPAGEYGPLGTYGTDYPVKIEANNAILSNFTITSHGSPPPILIDGDFIHATGNGIEITDNVINTGISDTGDNAIIANNTVTALFLSGSDQTIAQNTISEGGYGIWMEGSVNDFIVKNNVEIATTETVNGLPSNFGDEGIALRSSTLNQIVANNIYADICVEIDNYYGTTNLQTRASDNNVFYENNFISTSSTFIAQVGNPLLGGNGNYSVHNIWYNGTEGNYWSNYNTKYPNATEIDNSGIYNTPYVIDANNIDPAPLIAPYDIADKAVQLPYHQPISNFLISPSPNPTQTLSSTPSVPELPALVILPLLLSVFSVAVVVRHRKTANLKH